MTYLFVDLETTADGGPKGDCPEAHWHVNKVLVWGWEIDANVYVSDYGTELHKTLKKMQNDDNPVIVAHNLKFDLKYLMREFPDIRWENFSYCDTQTLHYMWSGHRDKFPGFEDTCDAWSVSYSKSLDLGKLLNSGLKMQDIAITDLRSYCHGDVTALSRLWATMMMDDWCYNQSTTDWIAPLAEMELRGMRVDQVKCNRLLTEAATKSMNAEINMQSLFKMYCSWDSGHKLDWSKLSVSAPRTVSALLTGVPSKLTKHKTRTLDIMSFPKLDKAIIEEVWGDVTPTHLGYPMSEFYIERLQARAHRMDPDCRQYLLSLMEYRKWNKLASTYFGPFIESAKIQGKVFPSMNTSATATGRLSSSNPNGQNMPPEAREVFCSENASDCVFELDFKQLEIVSAAWWSEDPVLMQDLNSGADVHFNTGKTVMGWQKVDDQTEEQRRIVKGVNFGLLFGGGPEGLSKSTGTDKSTVKSLIKGFFDRYPGVEDWQEEVYTAVCDNMQAHSIEKGEQKYCSWFEPAKLHRRWYFEEKPAPAWVKKRLGRSFSFKPTETKNYPVQGFAGADIVMSFLTRLWRHARSLNLPLKLMMTVHDSIVVETSMSSAQLRNHCDKIRDAVAIEYSIPVPLNYEIKGGSAHWR